MGSSYFPAFHELQSDSVSNVLPIASPSVPQDDTNAQDRICSVRGCSAPLPGDYNLKMCETCRGRHRIYATTKRAKRKAEKAAVVSVPADDSDDDPVPMSSTPEYNGTSNKDSTAPPWIPSGSSLSTGSQIAKDPTSDSTSSAVQEPSGPATRLNGYTLPDTWDHSQSNIDPRLYQSSSELAGALTYGSLLLASQSVESQATSSIGQPSPLPKLSSISTSKSRPQSSPSYRNESPTLSSAASSQSTPRYCSIKGCKSVLSGDSFFKMCDACRNRYRGYGITKRAKWRRERDDTEIGILEGNDSSQSPDSEYPSWQNSAHFQLCTDEENSHEASASFSARMCTVSHCRQILPVNYGFRRCEQHRLQNRHHSKLKREREKDVKAQAMDKWAKDAVTEDGILEAGQPLHSQPPKERERIMEPLFTTTPMDLKNRESRDKRNVESGIPPPARGMRRTNHVCSAKFCHNLLDPVVPWKMCEPCRERDRTVRKHRALRDVGVPAKSQSGVSSAKTALVCPVEESPDILHHLETTTSPSTTTFIPPSSTVLPDSDNVRPIVRPPSAPVSVNDQPSDPSITNCSPSLMFDELMLPDMPDTLSADIQAAHYASTSMETFTSVFQANVLPSPTQPKQIRFAKPSSVSSTPIRRASADNTAPGNGLPHSGLTSDSSVAGTPSDLDSRQESDANTNGKRKPRKKRSPNKSQDKAGVVDPGTEPSQSSQETNQMPTTVSPHSVEINPTQYPNPRHDTVASTSVASTPFPFSQYSTTPYTPAFAPPMLPYYMPPPFTPYGSQQLQYPYPPAYPYGRSPYYTPPYPPSLPPYASASYRMPSYPYHYPYTHAPYSNTSGCTTPSYTPVSYPQLQWSTTMTPQAPPPEYAGDRDTLVTNIRTESDEQTHKRKRSDDPPQGSTVSHSAPDKEVTVDPSSSIPEHAAGSTQVMGNLELPQVKKQASACTRKLCNRTVTLGNSLCDRCKDRLKRRQMKTKQRFKLEPKTSRAKRLEESLVQRSSTAHTSS